jgi:hypothetical protein
VSYTLIRSKCQICSSLSLKFRSHLARFFGGSYHCRHLNKRTADDKQRVASINSEAPDCSCEQFRTSRYSPRPVAGSEMLARFVKTPMHFSKGRFLPSIFSQISTDGCSVQREALATSRELALMLKKLIGGRQSWHGVLTATVQSVRDIKILGKPDRTLCVFDTSNKNNPAHAEMCQTHYVIDQADVLEARRHLFAVFGNGHVTTPANYRNGDVLNLLNSM